MQFAHIDVQRFLREFRQVTLEAHRICSALARAFGAYSEACERLDVVLCAPYQDNQEPAWSTVIMYGMPVAEVVPAQAVTSLLKRLWQIECALLGGEGASSRCGLMLGQLGFRPLRAECLRRYAARSEYPAVETSLVLRTPEGAEVDIRAEDFAPRILIEVLNPVELALPAVQKLNEPQESARNCVALGCAAVAVLH